MSQFDRYVGIPWLEKGRDFAGCDCWGLLRLVYRHELAIDLPAFSDRYVTGADSRAIAALIAGELEPWDDVLPGEEMPFDGVLMREGTCARHIGLVTRPGRLLHAEEREGGSVIVRYREGAVRYRVVGFYRFRRHSGHG